MNPWQVLEIMIDWLIDNILWIVPTLIVVLIVGFIIAVVYTTTHCLSGHDTQPYYHAPTYMMINKMMMPVGGGYYGDFVCDKWK